MKTTISIIVLLTCVVFMQGQQIVDDVYFKPSDANKALSTERIQSVRPNYKNGAREIIYIDNNKNKSLIVDKDTIYLLSHMNDSIALSENTDSATEEGQYLHGFRGGNTEYEYAERIRRFHNPKFTIHISDPNYTDIYFLDNHYWNVYVDGSYAWVTPTWTNPYWDNYFWRPYSYSSWYWRNSWGSPYAHYNRWHWGSPWNYGFYGSHYGWGGYYGGWGGYYPGHFGGWGYPYYHNHYWHSPYAYYHYPHWGSTVTTSRNRNYSETTRRREYYSGTDRAASNVNTRISGGNNSQAVGRNTVVSSERTGRNQETTRVVSRSTNTGDVIRGVSGSNVSTRSATSNIRPSGIDTRTRTVHTSGTIVRDERTPATIIRSSATSPRSASEGVINNNTRNSSPATINRSSSTVRTGTGTSAVRSTPETTTRSSSSSPSVSSPSVRSSSTPSFSSPSNTRSSSGSYSTGSSSSYSGSGSSTRSSGGSSSGGRR